MKSIWLPKALLVLGAVTVVACSTDTSSPRAITELDLPMASVTVQCNDSQNDPQMGDVDAEFFWNCGDAIVLSFASGLLNDSATIMAIARGFNNALRATELNLPHFVAGTGGIPVNLSTPPPSPGPNGGWNGSWDNVGPNVTVVSFGAGSSGPLSAVAANELSGVMGITERIEQNGFAYNCAGAILPSVQNTQFCQWEIEAIYRDFGIRLTNPALDKHIITSFFGDSPNPFQNTTVAQGDTVRFDPVLIAQRPMNTDCQGGTFSLGDCVFSASSTSLIWGVSDSSNISILQSDTALVMVMQGVDTVDVSIRLATANEFTTATFVDSTVTVTVSDPAPPVTQPSGFRVNGCEEIPGPGGRLLVRYHLRWDAGDGSWEIRHATVNNVANATVMATGGEGQTTEWTPYYKFLNFGFQYRYWWISVTPEDSSSWVPSTSNPVQLGDGCNF